MTFISLLAERVAGQWPHIATSERRSADTLAQLEALLASEVPSDTSVVVFGSLARGEYTKGSDLDWTLLIDGQADEDHYRVAQSISRLLDREGFGAPGPTGVFGNVAFSHPILHQIGGQDDTNKNTTQRILLLLESTAIGPEEAYERVLRLVLSRYVEDDRGLRFGSKRALVPRFLLNDIVRYWRTVTVDFVYKQRERADGWALRNAKLRMSRKLIFVSGLLTCFAFELGVSSGTWVDERGELVIPEVVRALRAQIRKTPLEQLAEICLRPAIQPETAKQLFDAYDAFLGILNDDARRARLKKLSFDELGDDPVFAEVRRAGSRFQAGLDRLFYEEDPELTRLIKVHGVF